VRVISNSNHGRPPGSRANPLDRGAPRGDKTTAMTHIPTPAVIIDLEIAKRNIANMAAYVRQHGLGLRPHTKTHKSALMARLQIEAGAVGLTVAKAGEADVMTHVSDDVLVAYPALDPFRATRVAELAKNKTMRVGIDSDFAAEALAEAARAAGSTIGVLVDLDVGFHRTGVQSPQAALELARVIDRMHTALRLDGIMCFPGQVKTPASDQAPALAPVAAMLQESVDLWKRSGLKAGIVSGGSTPTAYQSHLVPALTEIRPGTYIYNDMSTVSGGFCAIDDCAARVFCTVVSDAVPGKVVIDAGSKTLFSDRRSHGGDTAGFGHVVEFPQAKVVRLSEEHGEIDVSACPKPPRLGERVHVIPNHICPCINLHDRVYLKRGDAEAHFELLPIDARGKVV